MAKQLTFNRWRKSMLGLGWVIMGCGIVGLLVGILSGESDTTLNIGLLFITIFGAILIYKRKQL